MSRKRAISEAKSHGSSTSDVLGTRSFEQHLINELRSQLRHVVFLTASLVPFGAPSEFTESEVNHGCVSSSSTLQIRITEFLDFLPYIQYKQVTARVGGARHTQVYARIRNDLHSSSSILSR